MSFKKSSHSSLGVDIGAGGIKLVELQKQKGRPRLWTYAVVDQKIDIHVNQAINKSAEDLLHEKDDQVSVMMNKKQKQNNIIIEKDPRIDEYAKLLRYAVDEARVTAKKVTASLPVSHIFHAIVNLPLVNEKELTYHVEAKVKKMLPQPIEDMQVVHQVIPQENKDAKSIKTLVTAAPKSIVKFYTDIFAKAGLQLSELETEAFALERSLIGIDKATVMVVDIGAERTNFFIMDQGFPITHRSVQMGGDVFGAILQQHLGLSDEEIGTVKSDVSRLALNKLPEDMFGRLVEPIIKEIQYSFDLFLHQTGNENKKPEKIILTGGASTFPLFVRAIGREFPMKVFVGDPWARVVYQQGLKSMLDQLGPRMAVSIGLALRGVA
ncbi:MAG: pilus assembly protein PilM [bacterium]|nr:pilus assembly protein PilM [bacterium]